MKKKKTFVFHPNFFQEKKKKKKKKKEKKKMEEEQIVIEFQQKEEYKVNMDKRVIGVVPRYGKFPIPFLSS